MTEIIKSQNKENITISWCKEWKKDGNVCLCDQNGEILAEQTNQVNRYFARTIDTTLYGKLLMYNLLA